MNLPTDYHETLERTRAQIDLLALHEQAQREILELELTKAIRRDAAAIEQLRAAAVEKRLALDFIEPQPLCFRCNSSPCKPSCGMMANANPNADVKQAFPGGRW